MDNAEGRQILRHAVKTGNHAQSPYSTELMNGSITAQDSEVTQFHMTSDQRSIGQCAVVVHLGVVA